MSTCHAGSCYFPVLDLQTQIKLQCLLLRHLSVQGLQLPDMKMARVSQLVVDNIKVKHHDVIQQLCSSMSSCYGLEENLELVNLSCSDHGGSCCLPVLDLQNHLRLLLKQLSVESLFLPDLERAKLSQLFVENVMITKGCIECVCISVSTGSDLVKLHIIDFSCSVHSRKSCHAVLDLQKQISLQRLLLKQITVESLLLPDLEMARLSHLFLEKVKITKRCIECIYTSISTESDLEELHIIDLLCNVNSRKRCNAVLDLQKHTSLQRLLLKQLSVESLFLPDLDMARLSQLFLEYVMISKHCIECICSSVSTESDLEELHIIGLSCMVHSGKRCNAILNLQKQTSLQRLLLKQITVESLLLEMARLSHTFVDNVAMAHHDREHICTSLPSWPGFKEFRLTKQSCNEHNKCSLPVLDKIVYNQ